mmetsp:Transcript_53352/g.64270  ORF Transcript_53352/g.64270 Transcript_53352/m.64270 type:complete len:96 (+) Transcript_53352:941-1228(+)
MISAKGDQLLSDLADEIVEGAESLGVEVAGYILKASQALQSSDEIFVVTAFQEVQTLIESRVSTESSIRRYVMSLNMSEKFITSYSCILSRKYFK